MAEEPHGSMNSPEPTPNDLDLHNGSTNDTGPPALLNPLLDVLPPEMLCEVLKRCSPNDVWRLRCLSKRYNEFLSSDLAVDCAIAARDSHQADERAVVAGENRAAAVERLKIHHAALPLAGMLFFKATCESVLLHGSYLVTGLSDGIEVTNLVSGEVAFRRELPNICTFTMVGTTLFVKTLNDVSIYDLLDKSERSIEAPGRDETSNMVVLGDTLLYFYSPWLLQYAICKLDLKTGCWTSVRLSWSTGTVWLGCLTAMDDHLIWFSAYGDEDTSVVEAIEVNLDGSERRRSSQSIPSMAPDCVVTARSTGVPGRWSIDIWDKSEESYEKYDMHPHRSALYGPDLRIPSRSEGVSTVWKDVTYKSTHGIKVGDCWPTLRARGKRPIGKVYMGQNYGLADYLLINESFAVVIYGMNVLVFTFEQSVLNTAAWQMPHARPIRELIFGSSGLDDSLEGSPWEEMCDTEKGAGGWTALWTP